MNYSSTLNTSQNGSVGPGNLPHQDLTADRASGLLADSRPQFADQYPVLVIRAIDLPIEPSIEARLSLNGNQRFEHIVALLGPSRFMSGA